MKTVLHLSDLHLKNDDYPKEKLESLIQIIKNKKIDILVITGDLKNWDATFENSIKFINTLVDNIGIENVVIVPGNHDVKCIESASLCYNKTNGECNLLDNKINSVELQKQTEDFFDACKKINNCRTSQEIQTIRLYNFNFIIANSVVGYDNKKNNPFCCNCEKLYNHIQENITKYFEADAINVFVTHTNDESLCESSLHDYKGSSIISELNKICHIKLFGHLHVREKRNKDSLLEFCVGNDSFYSETLNYNLYNFTENSVNIEKLQYEDKEWIISNEKEEFKLKNGKVLVPNLKRASFEVVEQIFNTSKSFLKNKVFDLSVDNLSMKGLTLNDNTLCVDNKKIYNINVATDFFESISKLKQVTSNGTEKINIEEDVFSQLKRYLDEAKNIEHTDVKISVPITIKGKIGTGKTTFLNLFYYYLLQSIKSNFDYIPLYIDVYEASKEQNFKKLLENIKYWSSFNKKFYVILDGLDEKCVICNDYSKIRSLLTFMKSKAVLFCINEHSNTRREKVPNFISNNKNSEYILYFNGKSKIPNYLQEFYYLENNADYNNVIDLYFDMLNIPQNEDTKENVKKFISECNLPYIDYFILHYITKEALNCSGLQYTLVEFLDKVISDYLMNKKEFGSNDGESALELSYNYVYSTDILDSYLDFRAENLKSQFLIDYYIAKYLAEIIQNGNLADTAFQRYYSKSINYF
ncbi:MAG: metallophosphoesterase [Clostridia bacterium]|nr:metallophosphoesterase [Clostridia bacterium]